MSAVSAYAGIIECAGTWTGDGASFGIDGQKTADFKIKLINKAV